MNGVLHVDMREGTDKLRLYRMRVKIIFRSGPKVRQRQGKNKHVALALAALTTPLAVMALVLALWRLAADLRFTGEFPITVGFFSHWQTWLMSAALLQFFAIVLNRYGKVEVVLHESVEPPEQKLANSRF
jgi:hypothetical protein